MRLNIIDYFLLGILLISIYYDLTSRKIPNKITIPAILIGIIWSTVSSGLDGFLFSIFGFLLGLTVFFIPYILGGMGAGDVKLMAAIGAIKGWRFVFSSSLYTALAGGIIVIAYMMFKGGLKKTLIDVIGLIIRPIAKWIFKVTGNKKSYELIQYFEKNKTETGNNYVPYALAIAIGSVVAMSGIMDSLIKI